MRKTLFSVVIVMLITASVVAAAPSAHGALTVRAKALVGDLAAGRMHAVTAQFDARMRSALPPAKLAQVWAQIQAQAGAFRSTGDATLTHAGRYRIVLVDCAFAHAHLDAKVVYGSSGKVSGLFFVPHAPRHPKRAAVLPAGLIERAVTVGRAPWKLPGTLTLPPGQGPFPAVVLVAGSGPQDQDETIGPNKIFRDLAWGLAQKGIAVLRYEKRTKQYPVACAKLHPFTLDDETIDDARAAVTLLAHTRHIDRHEIFVLGHSLGGMAAPRIAKNDPQVAGLIIMAGSVRPLQDLIVSQVLYLARLDHSLSPAEEHQIAEARAIKAKIDDPKLRAGDTINVFGAKTPGSYWLFLRRYHPDRVAAGLHIPMLILQGGRDYQVTQADFRLWKQALNGHPNVTFKLYPELNHLFMAGHGPSSPEEYSKPGHVDGQVIGDIATWIQEHAGGEQ